MPPGYWQHYGMGGGGHAAGGEGGAQAGDGGHGVAAHHGGAGTVEAEGAADATEELAILGGEGGAMTGGGGGSELDDEESAEDEAFLAQGAEPEDATGAHAEGQRRAGGAGATAAHGRGAGGGEQGQSGADSLGGMGDGLSWRPAVSLGGAEKVRAGEPSISVVNPAHSLTQTGSAEFGVRWGISNKKVEGWIVQHVRFSSRVRDAKGKKVASNTPNTQYWEAWEVTSGGNVWVGSHTSGAHHNADTFRTADEGPKTKGVNRIRGRVQFIKNYKLAEPPWGHSVPQAGALPTMTTQPKGVGSGGKSHSLRIAWNDTVAKPKPQKLSHTP